LVGRPPLPGLLQETPCSWARPKPIPPSSSVDSIGAAWPSFPQRHLSRLATCALACVQVALLQKIYDDLKPKVLTAEDLMQQPRPMLVEVEDVEVPWKKKKSTDDDSGSEEGAEGGAAGGAAGNEAK
jgi:hypothetical protein